MEKLLKFLTTSIVEKPKKVKIQKSEEGDQTTLTCKVDKEDMGKIIGRQGRTIKAIRTLLRTKAGRLGKRVFLVLEED